MPPRGGKEHAQQTQPIITDERPAEPAPISGSTGFQVPRGTTLESLVADDTIIQSTSTQPSDPDQQSGISAGSSTESNSRVYQDVLVECNSLIEGYRKGEISKASVYVEIHSKLAKALGDDRARSDAAFGSFIATVESHDSKVGAAANRGRVVNPLQRSTSPAVSNTDERQFDNDNEEPVAKRIKVDESAYAWVSSGQNKCTVLRESLAKTLELIETYTIDHKATKRSLVNQPDCPEFPDSEWNNIITGRAVNLDAVLRVNCPLPVTIPKLRSLEILRSPSEPSSPQRSLRTEETGPLPGTGLSEQLSLLSRTGYRNCQSMENISSTCSQSLTPACIAESLPLTKQSGKELAVLETLNYPTSRNLPTSKLRTWIQSGFLSSQGHLKTTEDVKGRKERTGRKTNHAINGITEIAVKRKRTVEEGTFATSAGNLDIKERSAENEFVPKRPKYMQRSVWTGIDDSPSFSPTALSTLLDEPLPRPPPEEFSNLDAIETIQNNPNLFKIITPINVAGFEKLLESHPNRPFVESVCTSFREGFWPWANTQKEDYPVTWDFSECPPKTEREADFLRDQRDIEIEAERYSESFGTDLLPGMYSTPIHAVPKPRSEKLRLVNDHSAGPFLLNSMIAREDVAGAKMDSISDLIGALLRYQKRYPSKNLVLFKSDVSAAYRRLPLHPLWQVKQIVTVDNA